MENERLERAVKVIQERCPEEFALMMSNLIFEGSSFTVRDMAGNFTIDPEIAKESIENASDEHLEMLYRHKPEYREEIKSARVKSFLMGDCVPKKSFLTKDDISRVKSVSRDDPRDMRGNFGCGAEVGTNL